MGALIVNLHGGPGTGKSTNAAGLFSELKYRGINSELVTEYAKDKVWEGSLDVLDNQVYLLGKQYHRLWRLKDKVDVIVTDSPLTLLFHYGRKEGSEFTDFVFHLYNKFTNINIFLERQKEYNPSGRVQTEEEAKMIDEKILVNLDQYGIPYTRHPAERATVFKLADHIEYMVKVEGIK